MKKEYDFRGGTRGAVVELPPGKTRITIRIDDDASGSRDTSKIVTGKVDEHDVFRGLFRVCKQVFFVLQVFFWCFATRQGAGNGAK